VDVARLRRALTAVPLPRAADSRLVLAANITCRLRPDTHTPHRSGRDERPEIAGY
jgi:hypothetical protein